MNPIPIFIDDVKIWNPKSMKGHPDSFVQVEVMYLIDHSNFKVKKQFEKLIYRGIDYSDDEIHYSDFSTKSGFSIPAKTTLMLNVNIISPV